MKIAIVGAGPSGSYVAYLFAQADHEVVLFEEHPQVGTPVQCTGIVTSKIDAILPLKDVVKEAKVNTITKARIYAPSKNAVDFELKEKNYILNRGYFDQLIAKKAQAAGAELRLGTRVTSSHQGMVSFKTQTGVMTERYDVVIGADGPNSIIAKEVLAKHARKRSPWGGLQATVACDNGNVVEFYPYWGTYSWVVPEGKCRARIGLVGNKDTKKQFDEFVKWRMGATPKFLTREAGIIPYYAPHLSSKKGMTFLLGDAAGQVKATTGGGIIPGLEAAEALFEAVTEGKDYACLWKKRVGRNLLMHNLMRSLLDVCKDKDYEYLVKIIKRKDVKAIIEHSDREYPVQYLYRLLAKEPRLMLFGSGLLLRSIMQNKKLF